MDHKEKALNYFSQKMHCSQSIIAAFAEECGITEAQALKLGSCFGGGMRKGEVCGAVTGALMVLGLLYGKSVFPFAYSLACNVQFICQLFLRISVLFSE